MGRCQMIVAGGLLALASGFAGAQVCDWQPMQTGVAPAADAVAVLTNGDVVYGGRFSLAGPHVVNYVALWNGAQWQPMGVGFNNFVRTLLALPDGSVVAGGQFSLSSIAPNGLIARWNGTSWEPLGRGLDAGSCRSLMLTEFGDIIAGGSFLQADELPAWGVARWNTKNWSKIGNTIGGGVSGHFGSEFQPTMVNAIVEMPNHDIVIGGNFTHADGNSAPGIAIWNGSVWSDVGGGTSGVVRDIVLLDNGDLLVTGIFGSAGGVVCNGIARWDGVEWHPVGAGLTGTNSSSPFAMVKRPQGQVIIAGAFNSAGGVPVNNIAMLDPTTETWSALGSGMIPAIQTTVLDLDVDAQGNIYAAGQFASAGGTTLARNAAFYDCFEAPCPADLAEPFGSLDFSDVVAFLTAFSSMDPAADLAEPFGSFDFSDVVAFLASFGAGCP